MNYKLFFATLCVILFLLPIKAQNYQTFISNRNATFVGSYNVFEFVRIDSVHVGNDSIFYPNSNIQEIEVGCYIPLGHSWIGSPVIIKQDGFNCFINKAGDTIRINTNAEVSESWTVYEKPDDLKIIGRVNELRTRSFLGITDLVKAIDFYVYDRNNQRINHKLDDMRVLLSKNYGIIQTLNFSLFPDLESGDFLWFRVFEELNLFGLSDPFLGDQNLTWFDAFDFQSGDEIHVLYEESCEGYGRIDKTITKYLSRNDYPDSIVYNTEVIKSRTRLEFGEGPTDYYHYYKKSVILPDSIFDRFPGEAVIEDDIAWTHYMYLDKGNLVKTIPAAYDHVRRYSDDCWGVDCCWDGCWPYYDYYKGLGGPYYECDPWCLGEIANSLVYYKKDDHTWGTPLVITTIGNTTTEIPINISPNPANDIISIDISGSYLPCTFEIIDLKGQVIQTTILETSKSLININHIHSGLYFYRATRDQEKIDHGNLMIL